MLKKVLVILLCAILVLGGVFFYSYYQKKHALRQAVFMTNGQVYFGYIGNTLGSYITLKDVYYLKTDDLTKTSDQNKKLLLIKMGDELHSPKDTMKINKDQVLFYQDISSDSKVNAAIQRYLANQNNAAQASPAPSVSPSPSPSQ